MREAWEEEGIVRKRERKKRGRGKERGEGGRTWTRYEEEHVSARLCGKGLLCCECLPRAVVGVGWGRREGTYGAAYEWGETGGEGGQAALVVVPRSVLDGRLGTSLNTANGLPRVVVENRSGKNTYCMKVKKEKGEKINCKCQV